MFCLVYLKYIFVSDVLSAFNNHFEFKKCWVSKQKQHFERISQMAKYSADNDYKKSKTNIMIKNKEIKTENYHLINGDCVKETSKLPDNCADIVVFSPPFAELYVYSDKQEDMGNVSDYTQFEQHFKYLIPELKRTLKPGRMCAIHCMDLPIQKGKEGYHRKS
jgi:hypothetical protein